jgi:hypothetical protein
MATPMELADKIINRSNTAIVGANRDFLVGAIARVIMDERRRCHDIAMRGNEKEIAKAIMDADQ